MIALVEAAPGATRALVMDDTSVVEAHYRRAEPLPVGLVAPARLRERQSRRGVASIAGEDALVEPVPADWHPGQTRLAQVVRAARDDGARHKQARIVPHDGRATPAPGLDEQLAAAGHAVTMAMPPGTDQLAAAGWDDVVAEAETGRIDFPGGRLLLALTPAMLVIDVDGTGDLATMAEQAALATAKAVRRLGIGGSMVIDFPSLGSRAARAAVDDVLAKHLPQPFEKTAMNGFGLVQVIRPRRHLSLLEEVRRPGFAALELVRRAMRLVGAVTISAGAGSIAWLTANRPVIEALERLTGGPVTLAASTTVGAGHVQQG